MILFSDNNVTIVLDTKPFHDSLKKLRGELAAAIGFSGHKDKVERIMGELEARGIKYGEAKGLTEKDLYDIFRQLEKNTNDVLSPSEVQRAKEIVYNFIHEGPAEGEESPKSSSSFF